MTRAPRKPTGSRFTRWARTAAHAMGHPAAFTTAAVLVVAWAASGPLFDFGSTWQLVINTFTTILTFLMVFLLQNSQNRDSEAIQLKLDELIRALEGAHDSMVAIEELDEEDLARLQKRFEALAERARQREGAGGAAYSRERVPSDQTPGDDTRS